MADAPSTTTTEPVASPQTPSTPPQGDSQEVDVTKLSGEQLSKVLENPELWKNPRLAELRESDKQLKKLQKEQQTLKEKSLEEQKKFEELATERGKENETLKQQIQNNKVDQALTTKLVGEQVVDLEAALKLINRDSIKVDDNGNIAGVDEALESLKTDKAYLFNKSGQPTVGSPSNPNSAQTGQATGYKFKESQITPEFFKAHEKEIDEAYRLGQIEPDGPPR